jgi:hypothetical protein
MTRRGSGLDSQVNARWEGTQATGASARSSVPAPGDHYKPLPMQEIPVGPSGIPRAPAGVDRRSGSDGGGLAAYRGSVLMNTW